MCLTRSARHRATARTSAGGCGVRLGRSPPVSYSSRSGPLGCSRARYAGCCRAVRQAALPSRRGSLRADPRSPDRNGFAYRAGQTAQARRHKAGGFDAPHCEVQIAHAAVLGPSWAIDARRRAPKQDLSELVPLIERAWPETPAREGVSKVSDRVAHLLCDGSEELLARDLHPIGAPGETDSPRSNQVGQGRRCEAAAEQSRTSSLRTQRLCRFGRGL